MAGDSSFNNVSLLLPFDGANNSTVFRDRSNSRKTITVAGNAKVSTAQSKFGGASLLLDGTGDYLTTSSAVVPATSDFTIEFWVRLANTGVDVRIFTQRDLATANTGRLSLYRDVTDQAGFFLGGPTNLTLTGTTTLSANTWYYIAVTRASNIFRLFVDGVLEATSSTVTTSVEQTGVTIGRYNNTGPGDFNGYIDDLRITSGLARYTSTFDVPTAPNPIGLETVVDPDYANVSLLINADGATIVDESSSPKTITAVGNAALTKVDSKVGAGSLVFDGTGGYLSTPDHADFTLGSSDFTMEAWVYHVSAFSENKVIFNHRAGGGASSIAFEFFVDSNSKLSFSFSIDGTTQLTLIGTTTVTTGVWHHVSVNRSGSIISLSLNGTLEPGTYSIGISSLFNSTAPVSIGANNDGTRSWNGYIDALRITKGVARYTSTFTPPNYVLSDGTLELAPGQGSILIVGQQPGIPTAFLETAGQGIVSITGQVPIISEMYLGTPGQRAINIVGQSPLIENKYNPIIFESLLTSGLPFYSEVYTLLENVNIAISIPSSLSSNNSITDSIVILESLSVLLTDTLIESLVYSDTTGVLVDKLDSLLESISLYSSTPTSASFKSVVVNTTSFITSLDKYIAGIVVESVVLDSVMSILYRAYSALVESYISQDSLASVYIRAITLSSSLIAVDVNDTSSILRSLISDGLLLTIPGISRSDTYLAYLLSPETNSVSTYSNYNFNGCTKFGYKYLFYNRTGLYEHGGNTDNGSAIRSEIETVAFNFQTSNLKQVPSIYLGIDSTDKVILKVRVDGKAEVHYQLNKFTNNLMTQKIDIGKGLIGRYFQFELITEASEFSMESIEFYPLEIRRKL